MKNNYRLSYQVGTVSWNGTVITRLPEEDYLPVLKTLKSLGVDEVMLSGYVDIEPADFDMSAEAKRVGDLLRGLGMKAAQHHGLSPMFAQIGTSQKKVVDMLKRQVRYTADLNADVLVMHPGRIDAHFKTSQEYVSAFEEEERKHGLDAVIRTCAENMKAAGDYAEELGVKIALENVDRFEPMGNIEHLPMLVRLTNSPAVGYCLDSGHAHCCGTDIMKWIDVMGDKLFTTHFHDNRGARLDALSDKKWITPHGIDEHLPPGFGTIPWFDVISALRRTGYKRTVNFESTGWGGMGIKEGFQAAINYWRTCEYYVSAKKI